MKRSFIAGLSFLTTIILLAGCQQPVATPATTTGETKTPTKTETQTVERKQFGSLVSPDGKWLLAHKESEKPDEKGFTTIQHQLLLKGLEGQSEKIVLQVQEKHNMFASIEGEKFPSEWKAAGWSADGSKVFFVTIPTTDGLGGWFPNSNIQGDEIHQVDLATGTETTILKTEKGFILEGIADFMGSKMLALSYDQETGVVLKHNLNLLDKTALTVWDKTTIKNPTYDGIASAMFSPDATKIAIVTYENPPENLDGPAFRTYRLFIIDGPATGNLGTPAKEVEVTTSGEWEMLSWINENKILVHTYFATGDGGDREIEIK